MMTKRMNKEAMANAILFFRFNLFKKLDRIRFTPMLRSIAFHDNDAGFPKRSV
jgi:hypothetical protein